MTTVVPDPTLLPPTQGWEPEDFPALWVVPTTYRTDPERRADPHIQINPEGMLFLDAGNTRVVVSTRADWVKLVAMVERMWNAFEKSLAEQDVP